MQHYFGAINNGNILISEQDAFHISKVMRMKVGDEVIIISNSIHYLCKLSNVNPVSLVVEKELNIHNELTKKVTLFIPLAKGEKISFMIQKATELGVNDIVIYKSSRCVVKLDEAEFRKKLARYISIAKEAAEQSERNVIPSIYGIVDINKIPEEFKSELNLVAYEELQGHTSKIDNRKSSYSVLVGPEGGLDKKEIDSLLSQGFKTISLGKRILRVETAAIYLLSVLGYCIEYDNL